MRAIRTVWCPNPVGTGVALVVFCFSLTPSLLPRPWFLQGLASGILAATGYLIGEMAARLCRSLAGWERQPQRERWAWRVLALWAAVLIPLAVYIGARWQQDIHQLMGLPPPPVAGYLGVFGLSGLVFAGLVAAGRILRWVSQRLGHFFGRWIPAALARVTGAVAMVMLLLAVLDGIVANGLMSVANATFSAINAETEPGVSPPARTTLSGGPGSLVSWASLGRQGRNFVAGATTPDELTRFAEPGAAPPVEPIRVYVGLDSADTVEERVGLALAELERTGAFSRAVLAVITTTGTGWIGRSVDPLEYMYGGNTAMVAIQYSYLPSVMSFLVDRSRARAAGRELFNEVYPAWSARPAEARPKLLVFGESLGAMGAEAAFSGIDDMQARTDGVLLIGPPDASRLWREFVARRDPGTPAVLPTYEKGVSVRFAGRPSDLERPTTAWSFPRVVYLQHPSDPVVWWSPRLALRRPQWLAEARGSDVLPAMRWYPFVTFWQLTADLTFSFHAPAGHGHNYRSESADAWARIAPPRGWTAERTEAVKAAMAERDASPAAAQHR